MHDSVTGQLGQLLNGNLISIEILLEWGGIKLYFWHGGVMRTSSETVV